MNIEKMNEFREKFEYLKEIEINLFVCEWEGLEYLENENLNLCLNLEEAYDKLENAKMIIESKMKTVLSLLEEVEKQSSCLEDIKYKWVDSNEGLN